MIGSSFLRGKEHITALEAFDPLEKRVLAVAVSAKVVLRGKVSEAMWASVRLVRVVDAGNVALQGKAGAEAFAAESAGEILGFHVCYRHVYS